MPKGNDAASASADLQAAAADLIARGGVTTNVEKLIAANQARLTPGALAAQIKAIDAEATDALDLEQVGKDAGLPEGHVILSAAVRGNALSFVAEDTKTGRAYKDVHYPEGGPREAAADEAARERALAGLDVSAAVAQARANAEAQVAEAVADIEKAANEAIQKARDEANDRIAAAEEEAEARVEAGDAGATTQSASSGDATPPGDPAQASGPKRAQSKAKPKSRSRSKSRSKKS